MAKKIRQEQIEGNIVQTVTGTAVNNADPRNPVINDPDLSNYVTDAELAAMNFLTSEDDPTGVASMVFSGTTTKTLTITLNNGTTKTATFTDLNTTYQGLIAGDLTTGTDTTNKLISAKILVDYVNARLGSVMQYKGTQTNFSGLPTTGNQIGDTWNIQNPFSYGGQNYPAGSNVAWNGTSWDVLAGFIDTSAFLTVETDPTGVANITVTGSTTKTITITLNNGTTKTATFTDLNDNTTYSAGTLALLQAGVNTTNMVWSPKILKEWVDGLGFVTQRLVNTTLFFTLVGSQITGGSMTLNLGSLTPITGNKGSIVFLNGVKIPHTSVTISGSTVTVAISGMPTPPVVGDEVEVFFEIAS